MTERMCIVTRTVQPKDGLIRFVMAPDCAVVPDLACELPGRGVWVTANADTLQTAISKGAFPRGFKAAAKASAELVDLTGSLLARRALSLLSLAQKAGLVRTGFVKVQKMIENRQTAVLVHARDGAEDGLRKLAGAPLGRADDGGLTQIVQSFTIEQLSLALGRSNVVHAGLTEHGLTGQFLQAARKYEDFWRGDARVDRDGTRLSHPECEES